MSDASMTCEEARDLAAAYVLGGLEPAEEAAVREHLRTCTEPHAEFAELGGVVPYLALDIELVEPPASLRDRVMAAAAADLAARRSQTRPTGVVPPATTVAAPPIAFPSASERTARRAARIGVGPWAGRIAAVLAIVVLGGWNLLIQNQLAAANRYEQAVASVIAAASHPNSQTVVLTTDKGSRPAGIAAVGPDGRVVIAMRNLPATAGGQVYETWVITAKKPVAIGGFTVGSDGTVSFTTRPAQTPAGSIIAVTLEPRAGQTAPEGPIVAQGIAPPPVGSAPAG
jgi:anti-sigma factor RsiW